MCGYQVPPELYGSHRASCLGPRCTCPSCFKSFPPDALPIHASDCQPREDRKRPAWQPVDINSILRENERLCPKCASIMDTVTFPNHLKECLSRDQHLMCGLHGSPGSRHIGRSFHSHVPAAY